MTNIQRLKTAVVKMNLSATELYDFGKWVYDRAKIAERAMATQFFEGQRVSWASRRRGLGRLYGTVLKVNQNACRIQPDNDSRTWNIAMSLLQIEP